MKKISVIMSVYNDEIYVENAILSILNQTYTNFEFIICNDCSKDGTDAIIRKYADLDKRIVYFSNEQNKGLAASLNRCLEKATGEYIARMDSDDFSLKDRFEKQIRYIESHPSCAVVGGQMEHMNKEGIIFKQSFYKLRPTKNDVIKRVSVAHPTTIIRKSVIDEIGGYSVNSMTRRAEDYDLWCKIVEKGYELHNINDVVLNYREDANSIKKRKYTYRIDEAKIKNYWRKRMKMPFWYIVYSVKPLLIGLLPPAIYMKLKKIK